MKMKIFLPAFILLTFGFNVQGQNSDLFQTWYLTSYTNNQNEVFYVSEISPPISITLEISESLEFIGVVCNEYLGQFMYDSDEDLLLLDYFDLCLCGACNNPPPSHILVENDYFSYFIVDEYYHYEINSDSNGNYSELILYTELGFELHYNNTPLSLSDFNFNQFITFPNPATSTLNIRPTLPNLEKIIVYSISGKLLIELPFEKQVDVSHLTPGIYFIEISSPQGKSTQKFVKK